MSKLKSNLNSQLQQNGVANLVILQLPTLMNSIIVELKLTSLVPAKIYLILIVFRILLNFDTYFKFNFGLIG